MRTALAAIFAVAVVGVAAFLVWQAVSDRLTDDDQAGPDALFADLAAAWEAGDHDALAGYFRDGGDEVVAALDSVATGLAPTATTVTVDDVDRDDGAATATLSVMVDSDRVGEVTWTTEVPASRVRGDWAADGSAAVVHPDLRAGDRVVVVATDVSRAPILAHDGEALTAHAGGVRTIGIAPGRVVNEERLRLTWAEVLPESLDDLIELLARTDLNADWFYPVVTVTESTYEEIWRRLRAVPGVIARTADEATPTGDAFARHVLGRVGQPTAELAEELGVPGDAVVGLYGLERVFEDDLVGSEEVRAVILRGETEVAVLATAQDDPSAPLTTTLDHTVQQAVENALAGFSDAAAIVAVDTATAAIRASASRPLGGYNRAFEALYAPGDAFAVVAAEALYAGDVSPETVVPCPAEAVVVGARLAAPADLGDVPVEQALASGCDTTLGRLVADLPEDALGATAERFGFGVDFALPLPAGVSEFPTPVDRTEQVRAGVGQARVRMSALHLATVAAAADRGAWRPPFLLADAGPGPARDLDPGVAGNLRLLLEDGATEGGSAAVLAGTGAAGIGGTAPETGRPAEHAWLIGVIDDVAFAVVVEETGGDPAPAGRLGERFVRELVALRAN
jgi:cell division protein FtsI/penicillin-binding protein 2